MVIYTQTWDQQDSSIYPASMHFQNLPPQSRHQQSVHCRDPSIDLAAVVIQKLVEVVMNTLFH